MVGPSFESELLEDDTKSLRFGKTLVSEAILQSLIDNKRTLEKDLARLPKDETVPLPEHDECVVFKDYFTVGLRFPVQDLIGNFAPFDS